MELIEDNQDHFTIKLNWKHDLNVIMAILTTAGNTHKSFNLNSDKLRTERATILKKRVFPSTKISNRRKNHA